MDIKGSLKKILEYEKVFGELFYEIFFKRHPEAAEYFKDTDMRRQSLELTMALTLVVQYHLNKFAAVEQYLKYVGMHHHDRKIPKELYPDWRETMMVTLERFHENDWNDDLANQWREAIDAATETMLKGYDRRVGI